MSRLQLVDMSDTAVNVVHMSKMIQIRNVPDDLHRALKASAAEEGMSLSDYIKRELVGLRGRLTTEELIARAKARGPSNVDREMIVRLIREGRGD